MYIYSDVCVCVIARIAGFTFLGFSDWVERLMSPPPAILNGVNLEGVTLGNTEHDQLCGVGRRC